MQKLTMQNIKLSNQELKILHSSRGLFYLLSSNKEITYDLLKNVIKKVRYEQDIIRLQAQLINMQQWVINNNKRVVIIFEGRDGAGKTGAIRRVTEHINPRNARVVALDKPSDSEEKQWYFQRYIKHLPNPGEIVLFDRSWYNRAVVEPVNNFCTKEEYKIFMEEVKDFEKMITRDGIILIKLYFSINKDTQRKRFELIRSDGLKKWKITPLDELAQELWDKYSKYKEKMFKKTNLECAPWHFIDANSKTKARLYSMKKILEKVPYV